MEFNKALLDTVSEEANPNEFNLYLPQLLILKNIIKKCNGGNLYFPKDILTSSGNVLVLVYDTFVVKILTDFNVFNKIINVLRIGFKNKNIVNPIGHLARKEIVDSGGKLFSLGKSIKKERDFFCFVTEELVQITRTDKSSIVLTYPIFSNIKILVKFCYQILNGVLDLHDNNILHGDLRLNNIGMRGNDFVIFDFNAARENVKDTTNDVSTLVGSILFYSRTSDISHEVRGFLTFVKSFKNDTSRSFFNGILDYYNETFLDGTKEDDEIISEIEAIHL